jgi:dienelactone hydrolase
MMTNEPEPTATPGSADRPAQAAPAPTPGAEGAEGEGAGAVDAGGRIADPGEASAIAMRVLALADEEDFDAIRELFLPQVQGMVSADGLRAVWTDEVAKLGSMTGAVAPHVEPARAGVLVVRVPVAFERGARTLVVTVAGGRLGGLQLASAAAAAPVAPWEPPPYVDPDAFVERDVTLGQDGTPGQEGTPDQHGTPGQEAMLGLDGTPGGDGTLAVPGTLTLPRGAGPWPTVVMLPGSGPNDRDGTLGRNKPLKDVAWGLASAGIAVVRFDKVTYAHPAEVSRMPGFTLFDEYVPAAVAAVDLLTRQPEVHAGRIFVFGHSLGGTVAPRVAEEAPTVAGLILFGAGAEPMHRSAVRQVRYLAGLSPAMSAATVTALARQAGAVDSPDLSPTTPATDLPFGAPATYWLSVRDYDPTALAARLGKPILVLQGARDYQVTVADDLALWQSALAGRPDVTIRVYDADNHVFFPGSGPSSPAEYEPVQHVDPQVVADIATWIHDG